MNRANFMGKEIFWGLNVLISLEWFTNPVTVIIKLAAV